MIPNCNTALALGGRTKQYSKESLYLPVSLCGQPTPTPSPRPFQIVAYGYAHAVLNPGSDVVQSLDIRLSTALSQDHVTP